MSAGWVAGTVRARALARSRLGHESSRALALRGSLDEALASLEGTLYGPYVRSSMSLGRAQHGVWSAVLWHLRILAAWLPPGGSQLARLLAGGFEISNIENHRLWMDDGRLRATFDLGALARAWRRALTATTPAELRGVLSRSVWGDPGGESWWDVHGGLTLSWARQLDALGPPVSRWAAGAIGLMVASRLGGGEVLSARQLEGAERVLGGRWRAATTLAELTETLPAAARWSIRESGDPVDLWRSQTQWWTRVEQDASGLLVRSKEGPDPVAAAVALMAVDAWRVQAALEVAARGAGERAMEEFDALA